MTKGTGRQSGESRKQAKNSRFPLRGNRSLCDCECDLASKESQIGWDKSGSSALSVVKNEERAAEDAAGHKAGQLGQTRLSGSLWLTFPEAWGVSGSCHDAIHPVW